MNRALPCLVLAVVGSLLMTGCGALGGNLVIRDPTLQRVAATDGQTIAYTDAGSLQQALKASGAHDLGCPIDQVTSRTVIAADTGVVSNLTDDTASYHYVAEGCGQRAVYIWATDTGGGAGAYTTHATLVGLVPLSASPRTPPSSGS
jgi:hypothetical protein